MRLIIKRIINSKFCFIIIFLGFFISMIALSIGTSIFSQINEITDEYSNGNFKYVKKVSILFNNSCEIMNLTNLLRKSFVNSDVAIEFIPIETQNHETIVVTGILPKNKYLWSPPMEDGKFLNASSSERVAVVGRKISNGIEDNELTIGSEKYRIIGTCGKKEESPMNRQVFVPINYIPEVLENKADSSTFEFVVKNNISPQEEIDNFKKSLLREYPTATINITNDKRITHERQNFIRMFQINLQDVLKMIFISIFNIANISYFLIHSRKKEISLRKALGASSISIYCLILKEIMFICVLASITAFIFLVIVSKFSTSLFSYEINLSLNGFIFSIIFSLLTCILTSLIPAMIALKVQPAAAIKE